MKSPVTSTLDLSATEVRFAAGDSTGVFTGYAAVWDDLVPSYREVVRKGAFRRSLGEHRKAGTRPIMLWAHDPSEIVGTWTELVEDERGLKATGQLLQETRRGAEALALLKAKALNGLSIGFNVRKEERGPNGLRVITDVDLLEISLTAFPAMPAARVQNVREASAAAAVLDALRRASRSLNKD